MLQKGSYLQDYRRAEQRFRVRELLHDGADYQIALAEDTAMEDKLVCAKAILYDAAQTQDKRYVAMRRKALHGELQFLARPVHLLPEPLDWIQLSDSDTVLPHEPVLIYEYTHGDTLYDFVREKFPEGIAPARAIRICAEVCSFLVELHADKWLYRNLDPRHIIIGYDDVIHMVGCGNATQIGAKPNPTRATIESPYAAPEIRNETSGKLLRPAADVYAIGALLSFLLTAEEPRERVENPLSRAAFDRLNSMDPPGVSLVVARCMRPMAKQRFGRASELLQFLDMNQLPTPTTKGFGLLQLPAPWSGAEEPSGRLQQNKLSAGPLVSVGAGSAAEDGGQLVAADDEDNAQLEQTKPKRNVLMYVALVLLGLGFCVLSIFIPGL